MRLTRRSAMTCNLMAALILAGCGVGELTAAEYGEELEEWIEEDATAGTREIARAHSSCDHECHNCVHYAHCRQPKLPTGLNDWGDKLEIITRHGKPYRGCVAIMPSSGYPSIGHVAYVSKVEQGQIYLAEGNWNGACHFRHGTAKDLSFIRGYWCPND